MDKYLIVGLGNPDIEYQDTRHNIGYMVVDNLLEHLNKKNNSSEHFTLEHYAFKVQTKLMGRPITIIKPTTYMNLSGKAVKYWLDHEHISIENLFIIVDDLALPLGTLRLRLKGSDGGHNGLKNIIESLQTTTFNRMRFGIGDDFNKGGQIDFVLGKFSKEERQIIDPQINKSFDIIKSFVLMGMDKTMNAFNKK